MEVLDGVTHMMLDAQVSVTVRSRTAVGAYASHQTLALNPLDGCTVALPSISYSMSTSRTIDRSSANFTAIFDAAADEYKSLTKQDLGTHPFAAAFGNSSSHDSVLDVFRTQAQAFDKFRKGDDKLMAWLTPIVQILSTFSGTLDGLGLVRP